MVICGFVCRGQLSLVADSSGQLQLLMVNGYGYCFNNEPQNKR